MNPEKYLNNFDCKKIFDKILEKHNITSIEDNYARHLTELKKKYQSLIPTLMKKQYFEEMPSFNEELLLDVIFLNMPFVEEEKRPNFKKWLEKHSFSDFKDYIKEYIFPYKDSDKDDLNNNGILIIKVNSIEISSKVAQALNGTVILKGRKIIALTYPEFEKISKMPEKYEEHKNEIQAVENWEKSNFEEMMCIESKDKIKVGKIHFLKKTFETKYELNNGSDINEVKWSPQGKYLVLSKDDQIIFYGGDSNKPINELNIHSHRYIISNDENYIITFTGYKDNNFKAKEKKKGRKKGRKERRKKRRKERRKEGRKKGRKEGRKEGRNNYIRESIYSGFSNR